MADNTQMLKLYSKQILKYATEIPHTHPLVNPQGYAMRRSPLCGSSIRVWINIKDNKINEFCQDIKACVLGQAACSIIGQVIIGCPIETIKEGRDDLFTMLTKHATIPKEPFEKLQVLIPARDYTNRHASIMLCFDALLDAIKNAQLNQP